MNTTNPYLSNTNRVPPMNNQNKKCNCEDKYGPKPFNVNSNQPKIYKSN